MDILLNFSDDKKLDYINVDGSVYTHKQIEFRNGVIFMRMKKRVLKNEG